ncbi:MAG: amidohydrolase family protein, partial [Defluviitaleaceae bacterium]|nr:amidohydrolase family protein [Defluviitaleaceae bacterium]
IPAELKMSDEMVKTGAEIAVAEMISSGTISYTDMYFNVDEIAAVAEKSGIKANLSNAVITPEGKPYKLKDDNSYIETLRVLNDYDGSCGGRIKADASIHAVYTSCPEAWQAVAEFASSKKMRMHVHLSETRVEQENCLKKYGRTPAEMFDAHHVFDVPTLAAHTVWISDSDIEILAKRGVSAAHNPVSNLLLASGIAPVSKMLAAGINVSLGTDGMASNNSHDLFEEIKLASILQKYATNDASALPALEALIMATANGAKAQGRENETGRIAAGLDADLILIDLDSPRQTACYNPVYNLAYSTTGRDVCMTMCQGRILYENGDYKTVDIEKLLFEAREHVKNFI